MQDSPTMLERVLETEVMDTAEEAHDYDAMDHSEVNSRFCQDLLSFLGRPPVRVLDVGTGTALIPIELCRQAPVVSVEAIDLAEHMLALGRVNVERGGLAGRIALRKLDAKRTGWPDGAFEAVAPPHDWWDWYAAYMLARELGANPQQASASAARYMAESKDIVVASPA